MNFCNKYQINCSFSNLMGDGCMTDEIVCASYRKMWGFRNDSTISDPNHYNKPKPDETVDPSLSDYEDFLISGSVHYVLESESIPVNEVLKKHNLEKLEKLEAHKKRMMRDAEKRINKINSEKVKAQKILNDQYAQLSDLRTTENHFQKNRVEKIINDRWNKIDQSFPKTSKDEYKDAPLDSIITGIYKNIDKFFEKVSSLFKKIDEIDTEPAKKKLVSFKEKVKKLIKIEIEFK